MEISEELGNICEELSELNSNMSTIGSMITINTLLSSHPEMKEKVAPLMEELIKGLELALSESDE
jgi:hypothetical protein